MFKAEFVEGKKLYNHILSKTQDLLKADNQFITDQNHTPITDVLFVFCVSNNDFESLSLSLRHWIP